MRHMEDKIIGFILGIKFERSFRIPDISGEMVDNVLRDDNSPFNFSFFPKIQEPRKEKILFNPKTSDYLRINSDDIILGISVEKNFTHRYQWLQNDVLNYFKEVLFKKYEIKNIMR